MEDDQKGIRSWFNVTFVMSMILLIVYILIVWIIGKRYENKSFVDTIWDARNLIFTFFVAPNLIRFTMNSKKKRACKKKRHDMYTDLFLSYRDIMKKFCRENIATKIEDVEIYTEGNFVRYISRIEADHINTLAADKFINYYNELEEEIPLVMILNRCDDYLYDNNDIKRITEIVDTFKQRSKIIKSRSTIGKNIMIGDFQELASYYIRFYEVLGSSEKYRKDADLVKVVVYICMKHEQNRKWLKRQYDLACVSGIGYEFPNEEYDYG